MSEPTRNQMKVIGKTTSAGGYFQNVSITGECQFNGDVDCQKFSLTGESNIVGSLRAKEIKLTGSCVVNGSLEGLSLQGGGELRAVGPLKIDHIDLYGNVAVTGDCEADELKLAGTIQVDGLLSADRLELNLFDTSSAKEVGGSTIHIKKSKKSSLLNIMKMKEKVSFKADSIEGDSIDLQYTMAQMVRGEHVIIGRNCVIDTVEYRETLKIHKNAFVKHQIKL